MAIPLWQCSKCGTTVRSAGSPAVGGCPAGGSHSWRILSWS